LIRKIIPILLALAVLGGGGLYWSKRSAATTAAAATQYKLTAVETGEVKKTVSATGTLQPWKIVDVKARAGGELVYLPVEVGSVVKKDQVIARIDRQDSEMSLSTAQADYESASKRQEQSVATKNLQEMQSQIAINDANANLLSVRASVNAAKSRLETARQQAINQPKIFAASMASAKATYNQAMQQLAQLKATTPQQRASAKATFEQAVANRNNLRQQVERQKSLLEKGFVSQQVVDTVVANLAVNESQVANSQARLDTIEAELAANLDSAQARIDQAKAALDQANTGQIEIQNRKNSVGELESALKQAEAQAVRANVTLSQAKANVMNNKIRGFDVAVNQASIARANASLTNARETINRTEIHAPMDGVILSKTVEKGTVIASAMSFSAQGTNMMQIGDTSRMYVDVTVDETDIANVDDGQKVDVSVDAYPGQVFEGKVLRIDPQAVVVQNVTTVHVRVEVDNSGAMFQLLKPGMNATCEFVMQKKEGAIKVPTEAVKSDNDGDYVEVATGGKPAPADPKTGAPADEGALVDVKITRVSIKKGVEGNDSVEIVEGLKGDEKVVTQTIEAATAAAPAGSPFAGGGMRGGGFGGTRR
jgi:HlyD family secretion protein